MFFEHEQDLLRLSNEVIFLASAFSNWESIFKVIESFKFWQWIFQVVGFRNWNKYVTSVTHLWKTAGNIFSKIPYCFNFRKLYKYLQYSRYSLFFLNKIILKCWSDISLKIALSIQPILSFWISFGGALQNCNSQSVIKNFVSCFHYNSYINNLSIPHIMKKKQHLWYMFGRVYTTLLLQHTLVN